jgi:outer membrane protein TolC
MVPLVLSSGIGAGTNRAIGFVIIGGQSLVLALSLIVTPVAYSLLDDLSRARLLSRLFARLTGRRLAAATAAGVLALALIPARADAQTPQTPQPAAEVMHITADDVVKMATANNPDLAAGQYDPRVSAEQTAQARAAFLPTLQSGISRNVQETPPSSVFFGTSAVRTDLWQGNVGIAQQLPWGGGSYSLGWSSLRTNANFSLSNFNPSVTAQLQAAVSQPFQRNYKLDPLRGQVAIAQRSEEISNISLQELAITLTSAAQRAYWNLVLARAAVDVAQRSLDLSQELERNNKARVDVGQSPPLDLVSARAEVAQRRTDLITAQTSVRQAEDQLRVLILDPKRPDYWFVKIDPADLVPPVGPEPDVDAAVRRALAERTDLSRLRKEIDVSDTNVSLAKNAVLPDVRLQATYLTNGLGGTELLRETFLGPVTGQSAVAFGDVLRQIFAANYPTWTVGFTFSYPLGRSQEEATLARTKLEREQNVERLRSAEYKAVRDVRQAGMVLDQDRQRIETTRLARELSEQRLDQEQKRYEVGMSTNFNVIQAQRDLAVARNQELQAQLDYQQAQINFDTIQRIGGTAVAVSGAAAAPGGVTVTVPSGLTTGGGGGN